MELTDAWIHGLRRFGGPTPHRVRFDAKLVCLTGANESGKSTVLDALEIAHADAEVERADRTRREDIPDDREIVKLRYRIDDADRTELRMIPTSSDLGSVQWFEIARSAGGEPHLTVEPPLGRSRSSREPLLRTLTAEAERWWPSNLPEEEYDERFRPDRERVERLTAGLATDDEDLAPGVIDDLRELSDELIDEEPTLADDLRQVAELEDSTHPNEQAKNRLMRQARGFVRFDEDARRLESEYDLEVAAEDPGPALRNLASLAELDLVELRDAAAAGETGTVRDLREAANEVLKTRFEAWQQVPPITVVFDTDGQLLRIHVQSGSGPTMPFHERSDGLRQFVALVALTAQEGMAHPVLLIDEIETHLNYDAQADLIEVLANQNSVSQVVYTTHSSACLPEDLGRCVRVVEPDGHQTASTVRQSFWKDEEPGLGALLMAMGAASMAYVPLRPAAITEGGSDLVLLPSLLCQAAGQDHLGYPIVPGASGTPPERLAGLGLQGVRTAWVFDNDGSGRGRRDQLVNDGVPKERILLLGEDGDLEIEDLIDPEVYCAAVAMYLSDVGTTTARFETSDLPQVPCSRPETLTAWCEDNGVHPPGKVAIANKIVDLAGDRQLIDAAYRPLLRDLHQQLESLLLPND